MCGGDGEEERRGRMVENEPGKESWTYTTQGLVYHVRDSDLVLQGKF